jgi:cytochrome P450 family 6
MTLEEITGHTYAFFEAGYDTTALTTAYSTYELSQQRDVQEKLRDEIDSVLDRFEGKLSYEAIHQMPYLDQVIKGISFLFTKYFYLTQLLNMDTHVRKQSIHLNVFIAICLCADRLSSVVADNPYFIY